MAGNSDKESTSTTALSESQKTADTQIQIKRDHPALNITHGDGKGKGGINVQRLVVNQHPLRVTSTILDTTEQGSNSFTGETLDVQCLGDFNVSVQGN